MSCNVIYLKWIGYWERKITNTSNKNKDFALIHHLIWISEFEQPIPKGYKVVFKDKTLKNKPISEITINDLELISRAELMKRNSIHNLPKPLKHLIFARS